MKANELRETQTAELDQQAGRSASLSCLTCASSMPSTSWRTPAASEAVKKDIARVMTVLAEKQ